MVRLLPFVIAPVLPAGLLLVASVLGGTWALAGVIAITVMVFFLDKIPYLAPVSAREGHVLSIGAGIAHFMLLVAAIRAMSEPLPSLDKVLLIIGCGLYFRQISNSNAHELIHRTDAFAFRLGAANFTTRRTGTPRPWN